MKEPNRERKNEIKYLITLNEEQKEAKRLIIENQIVIITGRAGCLSKGTKVLMYDGTFKEVQNILVGDQLMGVDSTPRSVLNLKRGVEQMYWVKQNKGIDYRVNESHILSLKRVIPAKYPKITENNKRKLDLSQNPIHEKQEVVYNISIKDYLKLKGTSLVEKQLKGYISGCIEFEQQPLIIDPYYFGLWLGDGSTDSLKTITAADPEIIVYLESLGAVNRGNFKYVIPEKEFNSNEEFKKLYNITNVSKLKNKYIPEKYIYNSKKNRIALLSGLLDSDGHYVKRGKYYELTLKSKELSEGIVFISRSLGYKTNIRPKTATMKRKDGSVYSCNVYRISITPTDLLPLKIERKKNEIGSNFKNRSHTGIKVEKDIVDEYFGFELDGDHLFLLEDFTVTHNSGKSLVGAVTALDFLNKKMCDKIMVTRSAIEVGRTLGYLPGGLDDKFNPYMEALIENLYKCYDKVKIDELVDKKHIDALPVQFIRGKTIEDILIVEEAQNLTKAEMLAILTRLGKTGKIVINGDNEQQDTKEHFTGLSYAIELSKKFEEIKWVKLKENHRSDLVGKILDYEYGK